MSRGTKKVCTNRIFGHGTLYKGESESSRSWFLKADSGVNIICVSEIFILTICLIYTYVIKMINQWYRSFS